MVDCNGHIPALPNEERNVFGLCNIRTRASSHDIATAPTHTPSAMLPARTRSRRRRPHDNAAATATTAAGTPHDGAPHPPPLLPPSLRCSPRLSRLELPVDNSVTPATPADENTPPPPPISVSVQCTAAAAAAKPPLDRSTADQLPTVFSSLDRTAQSHPHDRPTSRPDAVSVLPPGDSYLSACAQLPATPTDSSNSDAPVPTTTSLSHPRFDCLETVDIDDSPASPTPSTTARFDDEAVGSRLQFDDYQHGGSGDAVEFDYGCLDTTPARSALPGGDVGGDEACASPEPLQGDEVSAECEPEAEKRPAASRRRKKKSATFTHRKKRKSAAASAKGDALEVGGTAADADGGNDETGDADGAAMEIDVVGDSGDEDDAADEEEEVEEEDPNKIYCYCRKPYDCTQMYIQCDLCEDWFHFSCANVTEDAADRTDLWYCRPCSETSGRRPVPKTLCASAVEPDAAGLPAPPGCARFLKNPEPASTAAAGDHVVSLTASRYCSDACGMARAREAVSAAIAAGAVHRRRRRSAHGYGFYTPSAAFDDAVDVLGAARAALRADAAELLVLAARYDRARDAALAVEAQREVLRAAVEAADALQGVFLATTSAATAAAAISDVASSSDAAPASPASSTPPPLPDPQLLQQQEDSGDPPPPSLAIPQRRRNARRDKRQRRRGSTPATTTTAALRRHPPAPPPPLPCGFDPALPARLAALSPSRGQCRRPDYARDVASAEARLLRTAATADAVRLKGLSAGSDLDSPREALAALERLSAPTLCFPTAAGNPDAVTDVAGTSLCTRAPCVLHDDWRSTRAAELDCAAARAVEAASAASAAAALVATRARRRRDALGLREDACMAVLAAVAGVVPLEQLRSHCAVGDE
ncbi:Lsd1/2 complex PHD finger containing protein Phf2 [Cladochytrium tenue]|nr:Lsd1/2 complex PHD finger containing protein Phf2 [Cladochytrium tenue]